jgi:hypothetical protein
VVCFSVFYPDSLKYTDPDGREDEEPNAIDTARSVIEKADSALAIGAGVLEQAGKPIIPTSTSGAINGLPIQTIDGASKLNTASKLKTVGKFVLPVAIVLGGIDAVKHGLETQDVGRGVFRFVKNTAVSYSSYTVSSVVTAGLESGALLGTGGIATPLAVVGGIAAGVGTGIAVEKGMNYIEKKIFE